MANVRKTGAALCCVLLAGLVLVACGGQDADPQPQPPAAATGLRTSVLHDGSVRLTWELGTGEHSSVLVFREAGVTPSQSTGIAPHAVLPAGTTEYVDQETEVGDVYVYTVGLSWEGAAPVISEVAASSEPLPTLSIEAYTWSDAMTTSNPADVQRGGLLRGATSTVDTLNPLVSVTANAVLDLLDHGGAALIRRDIGGAWEPYAATGWTEEQVGDGGTITVQLREGIRWSDGTPVTSADYVIRAQMEKDEEVGSNSRVHWTGVELEALGTYELRYTFVELSRTSLVMLASAPLPDHILGELYRSGGAAAVKEAWTANAAPETLTTTGPWKLVSSGGGAYEFERNPYFGAWNQDSAGNRLPHVDTLRLVIPEDRSPINAFIAGQSDWVTASEAEVREISAAVADYESAPNASASGANIFLFFNHNLQSEPFLQELFRDSSFRRAMSHLVNREQIIQERYLGAGSAKWTSVNLTQPEWINDTVNKYEFDRDEASRILQEELGFTLNDAGWLADGDGTELRFTVTTNMGNAHREAIANWFAEAAAEIGVDVQVEAIDFQDLVAELTSVGPDRPFHAIVVGLSGGARDWPFGVGSFNCEIGSPLWNRDGCLHAWEEELADLVMEGLRTLDDDAARLVGNQIQALEALHQPLIYTAAPLITQIWLPHVHGELPPVAMNISGTQRYLQLTWVDQ